MRFVNNRMSVTFTVQYRYQAVKDGSFTIPAIEVVVGGDTHTTQPLALQITATAPPGGQATPRAGAPSTQGVEISSEDLVLEATASKTSVYVGEPVVVAYDIYTRVTVSGYDVTRQPGTAGFWTEEYPLPRSPTVRNTVRNGQQYATATIRKMALFPTSAGTRTIDPMSIEAQVRTRRSRDPFDDFFSVGGLFGRTVPTLVTSQPITLEVLPLPETGRPSDFSGFVGDIALTTAIDRSRAETNEALTFTVQIEGEGNVRMLPEPEISFPSEFEVYPPETSEQVTRAERGITGTKTYQYVLIPRVPGVHTVPSVRFTYFDPSTGTYRTDVTAPLDVEVTGEAIGDAGISGRGRREITTLREDIRFIHIETPTFQPVSRPLFDDPGFWIALVVPVVAVGSAFGARRHRERVRGDVAYARRRRANRAARKRLARARSLAHRDTQREFYAEVGTALQGFLGDKLNIAEAGMIQDHVRDVLSGRNVSVEVIDAYFACLAVCDRQRFAPADADHDAMDRFVGRAETAMSDLDRELAS
jgi:hypothetical protein